MRALVLLQLAVQLLVGLDQLQNLFWDLLNEPGENKLDSLTWSEITQALMNELVDKVKFQAPVGH